MNIKKQIFEGEGVSLDFKKTISELRKNSAYKITSGVVCQ